MDLLSDAMMLLETKEMLVEEIRLMETALTEIIRLGHAPQCKAMDYREANCHCTPLTREPANVASQVLLKIKMKNLEAVHRE